MAVLSPDLIYRDGSFQTGLAIEYSVDSGSIGRIISADQASADAVRLKGRALLPGFVNAHSHAFQRVIRGRTQWRRGGGREEDFWSWREAMYAAALGMSPDDVFAVSRHCFMEMLLAGYTTVGEFHYLHRDAAGARYENANELAERVIDAAEEVGIRIRLLDVAYASGGIGEALRPEQRRFATPVLERYLVDVDALAGAVSDRPLVTVGVAPHSLRAVPVDWLAPVHAFARERDMPFHVHASEQRAEVTACEAAYGRRPVELLVDRGVLDARTTVVHATHVTEGEVALLGGGGATICACPTTERDLGDGFLEAEALLREGATIALGSDSQTVIDPLEEMRLVEYHERLRKMRRVILAGRQPRTRAEPARTRADVAQTRAEPAQTRADVAPALLAMATSAGARSLWIAAGALEPGSFADFCAIDLDHPALTGWTVDSLGALLALCAPPDVITDVWVGGVQRVSKRRHPEQEEAVAAFREVSRRLA
jgi:formimidoylglutamate deiminase